MSFTWNSLSATSPVPVVFLLALVRYIFWKRKWQPAPVFLPGESRGQRSLVGCCLWGSHRVRHDWSDLAAAAVYLFPYSSISNLLEHLFQIFLFDFHVTLILSYLSWFLNKDLFLKLCVFCLSCLFIYFFGSIFFCSIFFFPCRFDIINSISIFSSCCY